MRTVNLALQVATLAGSVFRFADMDAAICHFAREGKSGSGLSFMHVCAVYFDI